ncbi:MAG TPA: M48 family metalloprotease [Terriglobia bacterium]|nr:M48 family metalloprotease [Terriglobia bacterium]
MLNFLLGALLLLTSGQGVNFFSLKQDVEIGAESAKEAEQSLQLVKSAAVNQYIGTIAQRIIQNRSLPLLKYRFQVVNSKEISSLGFPGGAIYLYRGLVDMAANDDELAAMIAHEVGHVASRHGTQQLSRQLLIQDPIAIAAGAPISEVWKEGIARLGISLGVDAPFLRYSRDQELEASLMAVRLMANAQFDPNAFRTMIEKVNESQAAFVFYHPQAQTLSPELEKQIQVLSVPARPAHSTAAFREFRTVLRRVPAPPAPKPPAAADETAAALANIFTHPMDYYRLGYPAGWQITRTGPNGAIIAPADGVQFSGDVTRGVMLDLFDPGPAVTLDQATNRLFVSLYQSNQSLRIVPGAQTQTLISDEPALRTVMLGKPDPKRPPEVAWVVTRMYYQSLFYMVFVAPEEEFSMYQPIFEQMIRSARFK